MNDGVGKFISAEEGVVTALGTVLFWAERVHTQTDVKT